MLRIPISHLVPGMVTAEDVYAHNKNQLILPKGLVLTDKAITRLELYSLFSICIEDDIVPAASDEELTVSQRVKNSEAFREFQEKYTEELQLLEHSINNIILESEPVDTDRLLSDTMQLLEGKDGRVNVFDMLLNMRQHDDATYTHSINVALISHVFAGWLNFSKEDKELAALCGLLHDVGKLMIPGEILKKPSSLSPKEYNIVQTHTTLGYRALKECSLDEQICSAALLHHERMDGSGYPFGLKNEDIPSFAALVGIADVYDAMTSARVYRGPLCPFKVISLFESEGFEKYNTHYILTFLENIANIYLLNTVRLSDGRTGQIIYINKNRLCAPTIKCGDVYVDLSVQRDVYIEDII